VYSSDSLVDRRIWRIARTDSSFRGMQPSSRVSLDRALAAGQGAYFLVTGLWPLVSLRSFYAVTGPKRDGWLVQTVGSMIACIGSALLLGARRRTVAPELRWLATSSSAALMAVDVVFVWQRRIPRIYLADAAAELGLLAAWAVASRSGELRSSDQSETRSENAS
jgi:hypothetical protein